MNTKTMQNISYGLYVLTASRDGKDNGCIINTATQVTSDPQQITIAVNKSNFTHDMIMATKKFTVNIISEAAAFDLFTRFGFQSGRDTDKFAGFADYRRGANGCPIITKGTNAYIAGWVTQTIDLGTHTLFIASVTDMDILTDVPSATYSYYHAHIKPQKKAVTAAEGAKTKTVWRCTICGYEYEGEELPEDFVCPICKHPASDFEKVEVPV